MAMAIMACSSVKPSNKWEKLDLGNFYIEVPKGSKTRNINSIDSHVAKIEGQGFVLMFDFGRYSPKMTLTDEEYLKTDEWKYVGDNSILLTLSPLPILKSISRLNDSTYKVKYNFSGCLKNDSCFYHSSKEVYHNNFTVRDSCIETNYIIPSKLRNYDFYLSENESIYKRIFIAKNLNKFKSGVYILNKPSCEDEDNCTEQLSIWTIDSIKVDSRVLKRIFLSAKIK